MEIRSFMIQFRKIKKVNLHVRCSKVFRVIYASDSYDVHVEETSGEHDHSEDPDSVSRSGVYHWSQLATQIITEGVSNNLKPTVILRNLRTHGALSDPEPTRIQLNNKISHIYIYSEHKGSQ